MPQENLIQRGDLLQRLTRGLEIKGVKSPALMLEPTVVPIVLLEDLAKGAFEDPQAPGWFFTERPPTVAGQFTAFAVNNNTARAVLIVDRMAFITGAAQDFNVFTATTASVDAGLLTILQTAWADTRRPGVPPFSGHIGATAGGITPVNMIAKFRWTSGAAQSEIITSTPVILGPGTALVCELAVVAGTFQMMASGRIVLDPL